MSFSDLDRHICSIRSQSRGRADLILTDITSGESTVIPLRWRQLIMLSYEAIKALDAWPLIEGQRYHPSCASTLNGGSQPSEAPASPSTQDA